MPRLVLSLVLSCIASAGAAQDRVELDVLFIAIDDLNDWVGYLDGHPQTRTPNIDRLAARGMAFTNAQAPAAICHASRTAILTGLRPSTSGIYNNFPDWRDLAIFQDKLTLPRFFRAHGYATRGAGKIFHAHTYAEDGLTGFNDPQAWDDFYPSAERQLPDEFGPYSIPANGGPFGRRFDWASLIAEDYALADGQVAAWVAEQLRDSGDGPRFLAAGIYRPHLPWYVPEAYFEEFPLDEITLPPYREGDLEDIPAVATRSVLDSAEIHDWLVEEGRLKEAVQAYLASIHYADAMVGELIDALDASGRADRTIIVLFGDHGFHLGEKERWRKFTLWNESLHVPFIIVAPGTTRPGTTSNEPVSLLDIYPTLAELAGLDPPEYLEGNSLVPLLRDPTLEWNRPTLSTQGYENHAVVSSTYKYIRYSDGTEELYDVRSDPEEWTNLAGVPEHARIKQELAAHLPSGAAPPPDGPEGPSGSAPASGTE